MTVSEEIFETFDRIDIKCNLGDLKNAMVKIAQECDPNELSMDKSDPRDFINKLK
ncbi:hypothetical protein P4571_07965 [Niallia alba]|uniref:hypothetical protein n=1 Tax=Niallia alba TaxID=2729105 RepID=UPI002E209446|nr:hypothetical protein [Niallia alba]